jgi:hypothetical protein
MTRLDKQITESKGAKGEYKWTDLLALLKGLGFDPIQGSSSRVKFTTGKVTINLHKPHPQKEVKAYAIKQVKTLLEREGLI